MKFAGKFVGLVHLQCLIWAYQQHLDLLTVWSWLICCHFKIHVESKPYRFIYKSCIHISILQPGFEFHFEPHYPEFVPFQESMSSTSAKTADVEAGPSPYQHPRQPASSRRVSTVTYPMTTTTSRVTVIYPMAFNSRRPLAACRTLMNILCGIAVALTVFLAMYIYCTAVAAPSCPVHGQYLCSLNTKSHGWVAQW